MDESEREEDEREGGEEDEEIADRSNDDGIAGPQRATTGGARRDKEGL